MTAPARSWLFVPATRPERFAKAAESGADRVIVDLEDAVAAEAKVAARAQLSGSPLPADRPLYVRVNAFGTQWFEADLAAAAALPIAGILLPKTESRAQVARAAAALGPGQRIVAIVETAAGLWDALEIARAEKVERLAFGALDFVWDTGVHGDDLELAYARSRLVIASRVAGVQAPIDAVTTDFNDEPRLVRDAERGYRFGFVGKLCIHPRQVAVTNRAFSPSEQEVEWAQGLLDALAARPAAERGVFSFRGAMVDRPVVERARQVLAAAGRSTPTSGNPPA